MSIRSHASSNELVCSEKLFPIHALLDPLAIPIVLFHGSCEVFACNKAAERFIEQRNWLWIADKRLRCRDMAITRLNQQIGNSIDSPQSINVEPLLLQGPDGGKALLGGFALINGHSLIACTLTDPHITHEPPPKALKKIYGLTDAESDITAMIASGKDYQQIADKRNVSVATVRTCTKSIFKKLGVKSRAGVVSTVQSASLPLGILTNDSKPGYGEQPQITNLKNKLE